MANQDIVAAARSFIGVRWQHQGRSREGIDCAGLAAEVLKATHGSTYDKTDYPRMATDETMAEVCDKYLLPVDAAQMQPGDIVVFRFGPQRHMAVIGDYVFGGLSLIHAYALAPRKVVEVRFDEKWMSRMVGVWRVPEVLQCS
jgi:cell wall-associated NlpC family hydrolase